MFKVICNIFPVLLLFSFFFFFLLCWNKYFMLFLCFHSDFYSPGSFFSSFFSLVHVIERPALLQFIKFSFFSPLFYRTACMVSSLPGDHGFK